MFDRKFIPFLTVFTVLFIVSVSYVLFKSQIYSSMKSESNPNQFQTFAVRYLNGTRPNESENIAQCIFSLLYDTKILQDLQNVDYRTINKDFYLYKTFYGNPYNYDKLGSACSSIFYKGQNNDILKKYDKHCFVKWGKKINQTKLISQLKMLKDELDKNKIDYWLCGGSVIGSYRYHGIIPYDDDIDFYLNFNDKPKAKEIFNNLSKNPSKYGIFKDTESSNQHWKFGVLCNNTFDSCIVQIDFFFFWFESDQIRYLERPHFISKNSVYPLVNRPFEGVVFKAPNNFKEYMLTQYNTPSENICSSWNHHNDESKCPIKRANCDLLRYKFPYKLKENITVVNSQKISRQFNVEVIVEKSQVNGVYITSC